MKKSGGTIPETAKHIPKPEICFFFLVAHINFLENFNQSAFFD